MHCTARSVATVLKSTVLKSTVLKMIVAMAGTVMAATVMAATVMTGTVVSAQDAKDSDERVTSVMRAASDRMSDIRSARVDYLQFRFGKIVHQNLKIHRSSSEIEALIDSTELSSGDQAKFRQFLESYSGKSLDDPMTTGRDGKVPTLRGTFLLSGQKTRDQQDGVLQTFDGADLVSSRNLSAQTTIGHPSHVGVRRLSLDSFRSLMSPDKLTGFIVAKEDQSLLHLRSKDGLAEVVLERETGLLRRLKSYTSDNHLRYEIIQVGDLSDSSVPFPKASVQVLYSAEEIAEHICASVVLDARFNVEIPDEEFNHGVEAGVKVVDLRDNPEQPTVSFTASYTPNVLAGFEKRSHPDVTNPLPPGERFNRWWLLAVNILILVVIGYALVRRSSRNPPRPLQS